MKKIKIRLIDTTQRGEKICDAIKPFNELQPDEAWADSIWEVPGTLRNESTVRPDLFLLHIGDQRAQGKPCCEYLQHINRDLPDALIVLYSGGGIHVEEQTTYNIVVRQGRTRWCFDVKNSDRFCVITRQVGSASDFRIVPALEKYTARRNKAEFFNTLLGEALEYLPALAILCQGYLVVHAEYRGSDEREWDIDSALSKMGWEGTTAERILDSSLIKSSLGSQANKDRVRRVCWWRKAFGNLSIFNDRVKTEWDEAIHGDIPEAVKGLLKLIRQSEEITPPETVAAVYCAIDKRLGRKESQ